MGWFGRGQAAGGEQAQQVIEQPSSDGGPVEQDRELPGVTLHYATWGTPRADRAVMLVHGQTANHREWVELGPLWAAQGFYVVAPDLRGRGLSAKPAHGYGIAFHANDLIALGDALGLSQVHVVGHSLGAAIGLYLAALYPQRVGKLVMIDAGSVVPADTAQALAASFSRLGTIYPSLDAYLAAMRQTLPFPWDSFWEGWFRYEAEVGKDGTVKSRVPRAAVEEESAALAMVRTEALPAFVKQPTLILRATVGLLGPDRGFILAAEEAERLRGVMPAVRVVEVPETNHYTIVRADALREAISSFLSE